MEILNFYSNGSNRSPKKRARIATIIGGAFLMAAVGSTFAANITINTSNSLEYGQGLTQAVACESTVSQTFIYLSHTTMNVLDDRTTSC